MFSMEDVSEIHYDKGYGFTLFTAQGGVPVKLGNGDFEEKLGALARIYRDLGPDAITGLHRSGLQRPDHR